MLMLNVMVATMIGVLLVLSVAAIIAFIYILFTDGEGRGPG